VLSVLLLSGAARAATTRAGSSRSCARLPSTTGWPRQASIGRLLPDHLQDHVHRHGRSRRHAAVGRVPDWGPETADVADNLDLWRRALPAETMHTTSAGWSVADRTLVELYLIWLETGALDMIGEVDRSLHSILQELMEERLEEEGIEL